MPDPPPYYLLRPDGTPLSDPVIGKGSSGVVVQRDGTAVKLPLRYCILEGGETEREALEHSSYKSQESIKQEKNVFERLGQCDGVVECLDISGPGIQMKLMENGNLPNYLRRNTPTTSLLLSWAREMLRGLILIHERRVIVADITSRNFLLTGDLSVKFTGFSESAILPLDTDMNTAVAGNGYSIRTDIGLLGAVLYEVITGRRSRFDLYKYQTSEPATVALPPRERLPSTKNILLGEFIDKCWTNGSFEDEFALLLSLDSAILRHSLEADKDIYSRLGSHRTVATSTVLPCLSLDTVLLQQKKPDWAQRLTWIREAANAVAYAHSKNVILANVSASNFAVDSNGSLRLYNFSDARTLSENGNLHKYDENGISVKNDVVCYGSLVYYVVTGRRPEFSISKRGDLFGPAMEKRLQQDLLFSSWLQDSTTSPEADQVICDVIWNCWTRGKYRTMDSVCRAMSRFDRLHLIMDSISLRLPCLIRQYPLVFAFAIFGSLAFATTWLRPDSPRRMLCRIPLSDLTSSLRRDWF